MPDPTMRVDALFNNQTLWAVTPETMKSMRNSLLSMDDLNVPKVTSKHEREELQAFVNSLGVEHYEGSYAMGMAGSIAVIPIIGAIRPYPTYSFYNFGMATANLLNLSRDLMLAMADPTITAIAYYIDSPGGVVTGISEFAALTQDQSKIKPIHAFGVGTVASAAYWIAASADNLVVSSSSQLGSIGCMATFMDFSRMEEQFGIQEITIVSSSSPKKNQDPATDEGRQLIQVRVDKMADVFIEAVADARGVSKETVLSDFGQGDLFVGSDSVAAGLADEIGTFEKVLNDLSRNPVKLLGADMAVNDPNQPAAPVFSAGALFLADAAGHINPAAPFTMTAEDLQTRFPDVYKAIVAVGETAGKEAGIAEGKTAGIAAEAKRIQDLEAAFTDPAQRALLDKSKFEASTTVDSFKTVLFDAMAANGGELTPEASLINDTPGSMPAGPDGAAAPAPNGTPEGVAAQSSSNPARNPGQPALPGYNHQPGAVKYPNATQAESAAVDLADDAFLAELNAGR